MHRERIKKEIESIKCKNPEGQCSIAGTDFRHISRTPLSLYNVINSFFSNLHNIINVYMNIFDKQK
jgi:hypothetical protein